MEEARYNELASRYDASTLSVEDALALRGELIARFAADNIDARGTRMLSGMASRVAVKVEAVKTEAKVAATKVSILTPELSALLKTAVTAAHAAGYAGVVAKWETKVVKDAQGKDVDQSGPVIDLLGVKASVQNTPHTRSDYNYDDIKPGRAWHAKGEWTNPHDIVWVASRVLDRPDGTNEYIQAWGTANDPRHKLPDGRLNKAFINDWHRTIAAKVTVALGVDHPALAPYRVIKPVVEVTPPEVTPPDA